MAYEERFEEARVLLSEARFVDAIVKFNKAQFIKDGDPMLYSLRGEAYLAIGDFSSATTNIERAVELRPEDEEARFRLAELYFIQAQLCMDSEAYGDAVWWFGKAIVLDENIPFRMRRVGGLIAMGEFETAEKEVAECLRLCTAAGDDIGRRDMLLIRASILKSVGKLQTSHSDVATALAIDPEFPMTREMMAEWDAVTASYRDRATTLTLSGKLHEAHIELTRALELAPNSPDLILRRASVARRMGRFQESIDALTAAINSPDGNSALKVDMTQQLGLAYNDLALQHIAKGEIVYAIPLLHRAIACTKTNAVFYTNRGDCFRAQNRTELAIADYHKAVELQPGYTDARVRLSLCHNAAGEVEFGRGKYQHATFEFDKAIEYNPEVAQFYVNRARANAQLDKMTQFREDLLDALRIDQTNPQARELYARYFAGYSLEDALALPRKGKKHK